VRLRVLVRRPHSMQPWLLQRHYVVRAVVEVGIRHASTAQVHQHTAAGYLQ
jgi:hypothetical protein